MKVEIVGAKHLIKEESKLIIHLPEKEAPVRMNRIKYMMLRQDRIELFGTSNVPYKISNLVNPLEAITQIVNALENRLPQLIFTKDMFGTPVPKANKVIYPPIAGVLIQAKASAAKKFRDEIGMDLREWKALLNGNGFPTRFEENNDLLIIGLEKYFEKTAAFLEDPNFWKQIVNAEIARTTQTA